MNVKEIKELLELMAEHNVSEIEIEKDNAKIRLQKLPSGKFAVEHGAQMVPAMPVMAAAPAPVAVPVAAAAPAVEEGVVIVKSPMVGTFYAAPAPDQPVYTNEGEARDEATAGERTTYQYLPG